MDALLRFSRVVDAINERFGWIADWLVLLACLISAGNAVAAATRSASAPTPGSRSSGTCSPASFLLGASYTLKVNEHVRVDMSMPTSRRARGSGSTCSASSSSCCRRPSSWPGMTWPFFYDSWMRGEMSGNAGGLIRWPVKLLLPLGFALLTAAGHLGAIKRIAALSGRSSSKRTTNGRCNERPKPELQMIPLGHDGAADVRRPGRVHADRLPGRVLARRGRPVLRLHRDRARLLHRRRTCRTCRSASSASCRTTCCWRSRSSPSWARSSSAAAWPRTCWKAPGQLFGPVPGGLAYAVIIVGAILGAITGTVAASVIAMGMISLPVMMRYGYDSASRPA